MLLSLSQQKKNKFMNSYSMGLIKFFELKFRKKIVNWNFFVVAISIIIFFVVKVNCFYVYTLKFQWLASFAKNKFQHKNSKLIIFFCSLSQFSVIQQFILFDLYFWKKKKHKKSQIYSSSKFGNGSPLCPIFLFVFS